MQAEKFLVSKIQVLISFRLLRQSTISRSEASLRGSAVEHTIGNQACPRNRWPTHMHCFRIIALLVLISFH